MKSRLTPYAWQCRRALLLASALIVVLTLAGCGGGDEPLDGPTADDGRNSTTLPVSCAASACL